MSETKEKILKRLEELIREGEQLKNVIIQKNDANVSMQRMKCDNLLDRLGGERLIGKFNSAGAFSYNMRISEDERIEYRKRRVEGQTNFLKTTKENLELFDGTDEPELKKIKRKIEAQLDLGIAKVKYKQERDQSLSSSIRILIFALKDFLNISQRFAR